MSAAPGLVMGIPGLLKSTIECFKYVQLGRGFGKDFSECVLALDMSRLRLSRWGAAFGIREGGRPDLSHFTSDEWQVACDILKSIQNIFDDAKQMSIRAQKKKLVGTEGAVLDDTADIELRLRNLHITLQDIVEKRQKSPNNSVMAKAKWAIYKKERFDAMIAGVKDKVDYLIEEFPPKKEMELELCAVEVNRIRDPEDLKRLWPLVGDTDPALQKALIDNINKRGIGHLVEQFKLSEAAQMKVADINPHGRESKSHTVRGFEMRGTSRLDIGNLNM